MQCSAAYVEDTGITSFVFPNETGHNQSNGQDGLTDELEAILWHGGEAQQSKEKFKQLSLEKRNALLAFLNSL
ncbi:di-heme oxidoredictase family protein [Flavobacterium qiangtangense]|uniref:Di-heme oxidoredictase family protein n=1 Tax=Flavobacterium qiangtangense TaxID=1442595 RepID=A0ABW1PN25_9FLAO